MPTGADRGARPTPGHSPARRTLVAGAWASRAPAPVRRPRPLRREQGAQPLHAIRWTAPLRLGQRDRQRRASGTQAPSPQPLARPDAVRPRVHPSSGRDAAPVWGRPRWRSEAGRDPRAAREAGPRRRQGRWEPTHGEPRVHPSCLTGSGSVDGHRSRGQRPCKKNP